MRVGVIGYGVLGKALTTDLQQKKCTVHIYDKFIDKYNDPMPLLESELLFICLPTPFDESKQEYDLSSINENLSFLDSHHFIYPIVIKSTILPGTTDQLSRTYNSLSLVHCPEFLSSQTALIDIRDSLNIMIGKPIETSYSSIDYVYRFFKQHYPLSSIFIIKSIESESVKVFSNSFYALKVQFFNELKELCDRKSINFDLVKLLMVQNGWIYPLHTEPNGTGTFGGACLPKDSKALSALFDRAGLKDSVIDRVVDRHTNQLNKMV